MPPEQPIGVKIARRRQVLGITQAELATELHRLTGRPVSPSTVANWERGKHYPQRYLGALEEVLGISLDSAEEPDPREEELRSFSESQGGVLPDAEVKEWIDRYRAQRDKQRAG